MPASLSLPPRHSREHFEALARVALFSEPHFPDDADGKLPLSLRGRIIVLAVLAPWVFVLGCCSLAGL